MPSRSARRWTLASTVSISVLLATASIASAAPPVFDAGLATAPDGSYFDLDHGQISGPAKADLIYLPGGNGLWLNPYNSTFVKFGASTPTYKQCKNAALEDQAIDASKAIGKWFCALTNKGRVSRFKVIGATDVALRLSFTTWVTPALTS